jgi:predicted TIM-barrel fold metal-dependent hydrolase
MRELNYLSMMQSLFRMAREYKLPVAFHTGFQAGNGNYINNADPSLLTNLFLEFPDINFVLYHGSYPYGGILATLAKSFRNVYLDMNWTYALSPTYTERYLSEWLETVPVSKIMAFGGDQRCAENTYGQLIIAKKIISEVLIKKVREGYLSENEAKSIAGSILHDNAVKFYNLK